MGMVPELVELSDAASTDGLTARRFRVNVSAYLAGNESHGALLRTELTMWIANQAAFERVASGRPLLERAIPTARDLADLGRLGLLALDAIEQGKSLTTGQLADGRELLEKLEGYEAASASLGSIVLENQPPAALIILNTPDVRRLLDAAQARR